MEIKHQSQPSEDTCVSTCLAMILNKPVIEVVNEFHVDYWDLKIHPDDYLAKYGILAREMMAVRQELKDNHIYIVTVPSLNYPGLMHNVIFHVIDDGYYYVYDPQMNNGKKHYVVHDKEVIYPDEVRLRSWVADYEIDVKQLERRNELN